MSNFRFFFIFSSFLFLFTGATAQKTAYDSLDTGFNWPDGHRAAVCLTYDDGLDCHLDIAQKALDDFGFKGSFYCTGMSTSLRDRMEDWRALVSAGHELGNHTLYHPCIKARAGRNTFDWVQPEYDLHNYTKSQLLAELSLANTLLKAVDGNDTRTFAYTCSDYLVNGESFVEELPGLFTAARCDGPIPSHVGMTNTYLMPSLSVADFTGAELIAFLEEAKEKGSVAIFMFHGVGADYLKVSESAHQELLEYLDQHREVYWVDTFQQVSDHIRKQQIQGDIKKIGTEIKRN
jgi:sialate O-acetylesterase